MAAKTDSSKLSPAERLARKRAAARLRQQRCRARKRQAMFEKKRVESEHGTVVTTMKIIHNSAAVNRSTAHANNRRIQPQGPSYSKTIVDPYSNTNKSSVVGLPSHNTTSGESIYNCVSFESQRSFEEAQKSFNKVTTSASSVVVSPSSSPSRTIVRVPSDESNLDETLVAEEQAAIAAMLSLKTGSKRVVVSATTSRDGGDEREQPPPSSPTLPPKEVRIPMESSDVPTATTCTTTKYVGCSPSRGYPQHLPPPSLPPSSQHLRHPPTHHQRLTIVTTEPHYEVYEYGHPSLPPRGPPPRRVTPTNGSGYYRSPAGAPFPPTPHHHHPYHHPSHYTSSRGFYSPPRGYVVRYE